MAIPASARDTADLLTGFCEQNGVAYELQGINGAGRCVLAVTVKGQTRKVSFAAKPSNKARSGKNSLRDLKHTLQDLGWQPQEESKMKPEGARTMRFDAQKPSMGPAGPVTVYTHTQIVLAGIEVPIPPWGPDGSRECSQVQRDAYADDLDIFLVQAGEAGASAEEISSVVTKVGVPLSCADVQQRLCAARERLEMPKADKKDGAVVSLTDLEREVVRMISTLIDRKMAERDKEMAALQRQVDALRSKADKYDALKGLLE